MLPTGRFTKKDPRKPAPTTLELTFGDLVTTLDPQRLQEGQLQAAINLDRDQGNPKLDWRNRYWSDAPATATATTVVGSQYASLQDTSECEKLVFVRQGSTNFEFFHADIASSVLSSTVRWGTAFGSEVGSGSWVGWQHLNKLYFAGTSTGRVRAISSLCGSPSVETVYKTLAFGSNQVTASVLQNTAADYLVSFASHGSDALGTRSAGSGYAGGNQVRFPSALTIIDFDDTEDDLTIESNRLIAILDAEVDGNPYLVDFSYTWSSNQDWRGVSMLTIKWDMSGGSDVTFNSTHITSSNFKLYLQKSGGSWTELTQIDYSLSSDTVAYATFYARDMSEADRQTVLKIRPVCSVVKTGGAGHQADLYVDVYKGGETYNLQVDSTDRLDKSTTPTRDARYYVRYRSADGLQVSKALPVQVAFAYHQGLAIDSSQPRLGSTIRLTALVAPAPWAGASLIDIYRVVEDQAEGKTKYYRVVEGASNASTYTWDDFYADKDLINSTLPFSYSLALGGQLPGGTDPLANIICGCSHRGSNVVCTSTGLVLYSRIGSHDDWAWPGADYPFDPDNVGDPATYQVTRNQNSIEAVVSSDAIYFWSKDSAYAQIGGFPSQFSAPTRVPDADGIISRLGACRVENGAAYAALSGLWYVEVPFSIAGNEALKLEELTAGIRPTWAWLIGTTPELTSISYNNGILYVTNGPRYLRKSKEGLWNYGTWADSMNVFAQFHHPKYGPIGVTTTGKAYELGAYTTDGGTNVGGTNGTAVGWTATTRELPENLRATRAIVDVKTPTTATAVSLVVTTDRTTKTLNWAGASPRYNQPWPQYGTPPSGRRMYFTLTGTGADEVRSAKVEVVDFDQRRNK